MYSNLLISIANTYSRFRLSRPTSAAVSAANTRVERNAETTKSRKTALQPRDEATVPTGSPPMAAPTCPAKPKAPPAAPRASAWVSRTAIPHMALAPYTQAPALATATYSRAAEDSSGRAHRVAIETTRPLVHIMLVQFLNPSPPMRSDKTPLMSVPTTPPASYRVSPSAAAAGPSPLSSARAAIDHAPRPRRTI